MDSELVTQLTRSEAARKITQLFALERLALGEIAVAHPILAALQQVILRCLALCSSRDHDVVDPEVPKLLGPGLCQTLLPEAH